MPTGESTENPTTLPPRFRASAEVQLAAREEIDRHAAVCPYAQLGTEKRLRSLETRFSLLVGLMIGSGTIGGAAGAWVFKILGG